MSWHASFSVEDLGVTRRALRLYLARLIEDGGQHARGSDEYLDATDLAFRLDAIAQEHRTPGVFDGA